MKMWIVVVDKKATFWVEKHVANVVVVVVKATFWV
jgi:hypothetical protein